MASFGCDFGVAPFIVKKTFYKLPCPIPKIQNLKKYSIVQYCIGYGTGLKNLGKKTAFCRNDS